MRLFVAILFAGWLISAYGASVPERTKDNSVSPENIQSTICVPGYTKTVRPPVSYTNKVKHRLMRKAGIESERISEYELDHIIPLALGGAPRNPENLQLQHWDGEDGAHRKDRIEVKLQCLVCSGQVMLADAQQEIYTDWQGAYHKYAKVKCHRHKSREDFK